MKKIIFISFLIIGTNSFCQTKKSNEHNKMIPLDTSRIESVLSNMKITQSNKTKIEIKSKLNNVKTKYDSRYWYLFDKQTNKIIDTIIIYDFVLNLQ